MDAATVGEMTLIGYGKVFITPPLIPLTLFRRQLRRPARLSRDRRRFFRITFGNGVGGVGGVGGRVLVTDTTNTANTVFQELQPQNPVLAPPTSLRTHSRF